MSALDDRPFPRAMLLSAAALIGTTVIGVGMHQYAKFSSPASQVASAASATAGQIVASRELRFVDEGGGVTAFGGAVAVYDGVSGSFLTRLVQTDGFIRVVLNSLAFERTKQSITTEAIYTLVLRDGGHMTLEDPVTGKSVNLGAFGGGNRSVFVKFLPSTGGAA